MKVKLWRCRVDDFLFVGMACGKTMIDIFWAIDKTIDPYQVEIATPPHGFNFSAMYHGVIDDDMDDFQHDDLTSVCVFLDDELKWVEPNWNYIRGIKCLNLCYRFFLALR